VEKKKFPRWGGGTLWAHPGV